MPLWRCVHVLSDSYDKDNDHLLVVERHMVSGDYRVKLVTAAWGNETTLG